MLETMKETQTSKKYRAALDYLLKKAKYGASTRIKEQCGIDTGYLSSIRHGRRHGSDEVREAIAGYFGLKVEDMLFMGRQILEGKAPTGAETTTEDREIEQMLRSLPQQVLALLHDDVGRAAIEGLARLYDADKLRYTVACGKLIESVEAVLANVAPIKKHAQM